MNNNKTERVLFTGSIGFPFGSAVTQRQIQLSNTLLNSGYKVTVINRRGAHSKLITRREKISTFGNFNGIKYFYTSLIPYKSNNFIVRNIFKLIGIIVEFTSIGYHRLFKNARYIFNNSIQINQLRYYYFLSKLFDLEFVYDYVEFVSSLGNRNDEVTKRDSNNFDFIFYKYVDKVIVISTFLEKHLKKVAPKIKSLKIPPIIDFSYYDKFQKKEVKKPFFLFCGSVEYFDLIKFVIISFKKISFKIPDFELKLVLNGNQIQLAMVNEYINENKLEGRVVILSKIPYNELINLNKMATALLIPIKNNIQDKARFPFKICEYVASKSPIVTSNVPLINEIFEDGYSAYVAKVDDFGDFSEKMYEAAVRPLHSIEIGKRAYEIGLKLFDFKVYIKRIKGFLQI